MNAIITLSRINEYYPCRTGWNKLLVALDKDREDNEPLALNTILQTNGLEDAVWAIRVAEGNEYPARMFACDVAELTLRHTEDTLIKDTFRMVRRFATGEIGKGEADAALDVISGKYPVGGTTSDYFAARAVRIAGEPHIGSGCLAVLHATRNSFYSRPSWQREVMWKDTAEHEAALESFKRWFCTP